jgi:hypothetical protein
VGERPVIFLKARLNARGAQIAVLSGDPSKNAASSSQRWIFPLTQAASDASGGRSRVVVTRTVRARI